MRITHSGLAGLLFAAVIMVLLPYVAGGQWIKIFTSTTCFALAAGGAAFLYSRLNMVSLAQVALMGVGGWVMLRMNHGLLFPFEVNLIVAMLISAVFGMLLAFPALRMRGLYLALVTLMAAGGLEVMFSRFAR